MLSRKSLGRIGAALILATTISGAAGAADAPFGNPVDVAYAKLLWGTLEAAKLAGPDSIHATPYEGGAPHGAILETFDTKITVNGHTGAVIVKNNYGPEGITAEDVANNPAKHLDAVTVMFKRETGFDADNKDWFWAKYNPDGSVQQNPAKMSLAGRVAKGADKGCIACHMGAAGGDYVFGNDRAGM